MTDNRYWINYAKDNMSNYFRRRGLVFVDGKPLEPVEGPAELAGPSRARRIGPISGCALLYPTRAVPIRLATTCTSLSDDWRAGRRGERDARNG